MSITVVEHAGQDNETVVHTARNWTEAMDYANKTYSAAEMDELGVDILQDGSTEF